eukprot:5013108-Pyramimonas_sp.AAC.1
MQSEPAGTAAETGSWHRLKGIVEKEARSGFVLALSCAMGLISALLVMKLTGFENVYMDVKEVILESTPLLPDPVWEALESVSDAAEYVHSDMEGLGTATSAMVYYQGCVTFHGPQRGMLIVSATALNISNIRANRGPRYTQS